MHLLHIQVGHKMNNNEKIEVLNYRIKSILLHISALENDILINPSADVEGKPLRSQVLLDFVIKKEALETEKKALTNQG